VLLKLPLAERNSAIRESGSFMDSLLHCSV